MLAKLTMAQRFYNWVCSKDPNEGYNYTSCVDCACGRFAQEALGIEASTPEFTQAWIDHFWGDGMNVIVNDGRERPSLNIIARGSHKINVLASDNWTYGKLRERLEEQLPECVA